MQYRRHPDGNDLLQKLIARLYQLTSHTDSYSGDSPLHCKIFKTRHSICNVLLSPLPSQSRRSALESVEKNSPILKRTKQLTLVFRRGQLDDHLRVHGDKQTVADLLQAFSDADWAGDNDERKFTLDLY